MQRKLLFVVIWMFLFVPVTLAQQATCSALVKNALSTLDTQCSDTSRNQACYGHVNLAVQAQPDAVNFNFAQIGDKVDVAAIQSLQLSTLDTDAGNWGVALLRLQANLPDTLPGQNATLILFGDTEIRNMAPSIAEQNLPTIPVQVAAQSNANMRIGPSSDRTVIGTLAPGESAIANGRVADSTWVRIQLLNAVGRSGWVFRDLLASDANFADLQVVAPGVPNFGPMQAFQLSTGIGEMQCQEVPQNGLLVQTPQGAGHINLLVNQVQVSMGSTVFLTAPREEDDNNDATINIGSMQVKVLEGTGRVTANSQTSTAVAGTQIEIELDEDLNPVGIPTDPEPYDLDDLESLPIEYLEREIDIEDALDEEALALVIEYSDLLDDVDLEDVDDVLDYLEESAEDLDLETYLEEELGYEASEVIELLAEDADALLDEFDEADLDELEEFCEDEDCEEFFEEEFVEEEFFDEPDEPDEPDPPDDPDPPPGP